MSLVHHDVFSYGKSQPHQTMYDASELHDLSGTGTPEIYNNFGNSVVSDIGRTKAIAQNNSGLATNGST